jgi:hypothetical protein
MKSSKAFTSILLAVLLITGYEAARADGLNHDETRAYIGLRWMFGDAIGVMPSFMLGIRHTRTNTNNVVTGGDLALALRLENFSPDEIRISLLEGKCDFIGQYGVGYSLKKQSNLFFVGLVGPYSKASVEIDSGKNPAAGFELNTQDCATTRRI